MTSAPENFFSSELAITLKIPADFLEIAAQNQVSADALLVFLGLFQLLAYSQDEAQLAAEFSLKELLIARVFKPEEARFTLALEELEQAGMVLRYYQPDKHGAALLCPSTPQNRELLAGLEAEKTQLSDVRIADQIPLEARPNIFRLYEENIGPLTPLMVEILKEDAQKYPPEWIEEAIAEALKNNARNWKYVSAILSSWKEKGHGRRKEEAPQDLERYRELYRQQHKQSDK